MLEVSHALDIRIQTPQVLETCFADIAHRFQIAIGQPFEIANEIGAPISASDNTHNDWFFHITANDPRLSCRPWPISVLAGKATLLRCSSCSKATIRAAPMPTGKAYIDLDSGWLSNIFGLFIRADNTNSQAVVLLLNR
jgi:hypothetical protein